jgi:hypothetical protein
MSESALERTIREAFEDGTLAVLRTPEELGELLVSTPGAPSGTRTFLVTAVDDLNELSPVEVLAGQVFEARRAMARQIADGTVPQDHPMAHRYSGPGYTDGVHESQQRILGQSVEVRVAHVLNAAKWAVIEQGDH